jgi:type I restriction enzyme S subunit
MKGKIGEKVRTEWRKVRLGEVAEFKTGKLNSNAAKPSGEYPFFTCSQETFRTDTYSFDTECVLLGGNNASGIYPLKYFSGKFDAYQRTYVIESLDNKRLLNRYLYYTLRPKLDLLKSISTGAATKFLTLTILNALTIELPSLKEQHKIASVLSAYDDLIENNNRRIKILEEMAQAIYKEWFVNFRFPGHEKVRMVKSELGMIPEGWEVKRLGEIVSNINEATNAGDHLYRLPYVPIDCIPRKQLGLTEFKRGNEAQSSLVLFKKNDILFGAMRSYFHKVIIAPFDGVTRKTCFVLRPIQTTDFAFAVLTLFQDSTVGFASQHSRGSTIPYAVWEQVFENMPIIKPHQKVRTIFNELVESLLIKISTTLLSNLNLRKTRDLLLPKLISGEIDLGKNDA